MLDHPSPDMKPSQMRRFVGKVTLFGCAFLILISLPHILVAGFKRHLHNLWCAKNRMDLRRPEESCIFLSGSSTIKYGCDPEQLERLTGTPVALCASDAYSPARNYFDLVDLVNPGDMVIQSIDPWVYTQAYCSIHTERLITLPAHNRLKLGQVDLFPQSLLQQNQRVIELLFSCLFPFRPSAPQHQCKDASYRPSDRLEACTNDPVLDEFQLTFIDSLNHLCTSRNAALILVTIPRTARYNEHSNILDSLVCSQYPSITNQVIQFHNSDTTLFADDTHLNCKGTNWFTDQLAHHITQVNALQQP